MTDTVNPPAPRWDATAALVLAAASLVASVIAITIALSTGPLAPSGIDVPPVQSPPDRASAGQVEAVAEVTLPPGTILLSAAYSNGLETMLSAKIRLPPEALDTFLTSAKLAGELTVGLHAITAAHNVGGGNLWNPDPPQSPSAVYASGNPTHRGTQRTLMLNLDTPTAVTVYLHAHRG